MNQYLIDYVPSPFLWVASMKYSEDAWKINVRLVASGQLHKVTPFDVLAFSLLLVQ